MAARVCDRCPELVALPDDLADAAIEVLCPTCLAARDAARLAARRRRVGTPPDLVDYTFECIDNPTGAEDAIKLAQHWGAGDIALAGLSGGVGTGKTHIAAAAANALSAHRRVQFYYGPDLFAILGSGGFRDPARTAALNVLRGNYALVIDDFDKVTPTAYAAEVLSLAINGRTLGQAPLFITTNLRSKELSEMWPQPYGQSLSSRLTLLTWARCKGDDRRIQRHQERHQERRRVA